MSRQNATMSRADFLKTGAVSSGIALGLTGASTAVSNAHADETAASGDTSEVVWDHEADIAIVGSGLGGFAAAFGAHENGASTVMVEISTTTGGGSSFCGGMIHIAAAGTGDATDEVYDDYTEGLNLNQELPHAYFNDFRDFIDWLINLGLSVTPFHLTAIDGQDWGNIAYMGPEAGLGITGCRPFFDSCEELYKSQGGTLLMETVAQHIITDARGTIIGLQCRDNNTRQIINIKANAIVLATGGFQGDEEYRTRYFGRDASMATIHAVPYATGSGLKMALEIGASLGGSMDTFAGNYAPAYPAVNHMTDPAYYEQCGYPEDGKGGKFWLYDNHLDFLADGSIFVNLEVKRFCDEGEEDYRPQQAIVRQTHATAIMIADDPVFQSWWESPTYTFRTIKEEFEDCILSEETKGSLFEADTIEELADQLIASKIFKIQTLC